jgi:hypothetical protein
MKIDQNFSNPCFGLSPLGFKTMLLILFLVSFSGTPMAFAMNWEGHDDWLTEEAHAQALRTTLPKATPIAKAFPLCAEREVLHAHNPYEQRPLVGINCIDPKAETAQPIQ